MEIFLRPGEKERDFALLAEWFTLLEGETNTEAGLKDDYERHKERIIRLMVAEDARSERLGFNWMVISRFDASEVYFYLYVAPEHRRQGVGSRLWEDLQPLLAQYRIQKMTVNVPDNIPEGLAFAQKRGFTLRNHHLAMALDLTTFDDRPYEAVIDRLKGEGFRSTNMAELGNTEEAQRLLYQLNDTTSSETMGSDGSHAWLDFDDFQRSVCQAAWYKPDGQMVVIDTTTGTWAAMSAITRFEGSDHAYNLFTGVDQRYRGRGLAQAVKVIALRYARDVLKVSSVKTHHNHHNEPMLAIDRKLGYVQIPGYYSMQLLKES